MLQAPALDLPLNPQLYIMYIIGVAASLTRRRATLVVP